MLTISLKREVDQFAVPPLWFSFTPTLDTLRDAFFTRAFGQYLITSAIVAVTSTICALGYWNLPPMPSRDSRCRAGSTASFLSGFSRRECFPPIVTAVPLFLMMRDWTAQHARLADNRLHRIQSSFCRLDDAWFFC